MTSDAIFLKAQSLLPGGVNSPVRAFKSVGGTPRVIARAVGAELIDVEGRSYIDCVGAWGAGILGHAHAAVAQAITQAVELGPSPGLCNGLEVSLAREITARVPCAERIRFVNSGTEAVMSAVRLARAATGRDIVLKFEGGYHGHADAMLVRAGSGAATLGLPDSPGVTRGAAADTRVCAYNDLEAVEATAAAEGERLAAVIVEPVAGNMGVVPPVEGFLQGVRTVCTRVGALLIFDEVMTGFRVARGGAAARSGVRPDLITLGKIIGGGLPIGAYAGRADLMNLVAPAGPVYQAGTFCGHPVVMAAGLATLAQLTEGDYAKLESAGEKVERGLCSALKAAGESGCVQRVGSMLTLYFGVERVRDFADARRADHARFARFFQGMLARGVHLPPSGYEAWFLSTAHDDAVLDRLLRAAEEALRERIWPQVCDELRLESLHLNPGISAPDVPSL